MTRDARKRVVILFLFILFLSALSAAPLPPSFPLPHHVSSWNTATQEVSPLPALQGHRGPGFQSLEAEELAKIPEVEAYLKRYATPDRHTYMSRVLTRGAPYLPFIYSVAREMDLPWELAYLPIIESAFIPTAVSRSGATGFWQFMLNSISPYEIRVNQWIDERRDFWKATYGALKKLKQNYDILGDWLLAVGAYNCGLGCMQRAVDAAGTKDFWTLAREGYLPAETVSYVPRFIAVSHFASYPGRYDLPRQWHAVTWQRIKVTAPVHLNRLSEAAGVPLRSLTSANAELNQPVTPPLKSGYWLKVEQEFADSIEDALRRNGSALTDLETYTIQNGDTLYALSRYYGVSTDLILEFNPRVNPRRLVIGEKILIPLMQPMPPYQGPVSDLPGTTYDAIQNYTVRQGDTLTSIGRLFGTTAAALAFNNGMTLTSILKPGMVLKVPFEEIAEELQDSGDEVPR